MNIPQGQGQGQGQPASPAQGDGMGAGEGQAMGGGMQPPGEMYDADAQLEALKQTAMGEQFDPQMSQEQIAQWDETVRSGAMEMTLILKSQVPGITNDQVNSIISDRLKSGGIQSLTRAGMANFPNEVKSWLNATRSSIELASREPSRREEAADLPTNSTSDNLGAGRSGQAPLDSWDKWDQELDRRGW